MQDLKEFSSPGLDLRVRGELSREQDLFRVQYEVLGDIQRLIIPERPPAPARRRELWKTTCLELFLSPLASTTYFEFNFSPSGDWNCYAFDRYREGMRVDPRLSAMQIHVHSDSDRLLVEASFDVSTISELRGPIDYSITAVIEKKNGAQSFWALQHCGSRPDFHLRESFCGLSSRD